MPGQIFDNKTGRVERAVVVRGDDPRAEIKLIEGVATEVPPKPKEKEPPDFFTGLFALLFGGGGMWFAIAWNWHGDRFGPAMCAGFSGLLLFVGYVVLYECVRRWKAALAKWWGGRS